jgi:hypothetical protein
MGKGRPTSHPAGRDRGEAEAAGRQSFPVCGAGEVAVAGRTSSRWIALRLLGRPHRDYRDDTELGRLPARRRYAHVLGGLADRRLTLPSISDVSLDKSPTTLGRLGALAIGGKY